MQNEERSFEDLRRAMILEITQDGQVFDSRVIAAMADVPRHEFVPEQYRAYSYEDRALPIGERQTISQPTMVAIMTQALDVREDHITLEVGAGSGYQAAVLAKMCRKVYALERHAPLADTARETLSRLGYGNIQIIVGDGSGGYAQHAPYHRIIVSAGSPDVPDVLVDQLLIGGKLVIPVGDLSYQSLLLVEKTVTGVRQREIAGCVFVPLIGKHGWPQDQERPE